jgi:hypothetical protein
MNKKLKEFNNTGNTRTESYHTFRGNTIPWIEKLLQTPIDDYRKILFPGKKIANMIK